MARSRRHAAIASITTAASEKQDKRWANRNCRSAPRIIVERDTDPGAILLPILREVSDEWSIAKNGRSWFGHHLPKLKRK